MRKYLVIIFDRNTNETLAEYEIELTWHEQTFVDARHIGLNKFENEIIKPSGHTWLSYKKNHDYCADSLLLEGEE